MDFAYIAAKREAIFRAEALARAGGGKDMPMPCKEPHTP